MALATGAPQLLDRSFAFSPDVRPALGNFVNLTCAFAPLERYGRRYLAQRRVTIYLAMNIWTRFLL